MDEYTGIVDSVVRKAEEAMPEVDGDYRNDSGQLICGKCHTPKTFFAAFLGRQVPIRCQCKKDEDDALTHDSRIQELLKSSGIPDKYKKACFANLQSDPENSREIKLLRRYAEKFSELRKQNQGLLISGSVGTGKTHIAVCAAHHIINQGYYVRFISLPQLLQTAKPLNSYEEDKILQSVSSAELLIVDDLGAERNTEYALEFVYNIINTRCNARKPLIVTTNLNFNEMSQDTDLKHARIYDRVFEACPYPVVFKGESKRRMIAADKFDVLSKMLEDTDD